MPSDIDSQWKAWNAEHPERRLTRAQFRLERGGKKPTWEDYRKPTFTVSRSELGLEPKPLQRVFLIPDTHVPYHSLDAYSLALRAREYFKPDHTVILGDFADCMAVSFHDKESERSQDFAWEVEQVNKALDRIVDLGDEKHYVMGNHEVRLQRYLNQKAPEIFRLLSIEQLFKLQQRGWNVTPYGQSTRLGKLNITHDEGNAGPLAAAKARDTFQGNVVIGHNHAMAVCYQGNAQGSAHVGASFGWLGDLDTISYMHRVRAQRWVHGFGIAYLETDTGNVHLQGVPIVDGKVLIEGKLIT